VSTRGELAKLHRRIGATMIYVTHDQVEAMTLGQKICIMNGGKVIQVGPPLEVYRRPANTFVAAFLGNPPMNLIPAVVVDAPDGRSLKVGDSVLKLPAERMPPQPPGAEVTLGIRPENVALAATACEVTAAIDGEVTQLEPLGAETIVFARMPGIEREMVARVDPDAAAPIGARCTFHCDLAAAHVFDSAGNAV
jgi:multiple sugar transport system ATP-binding protein